MSREIGDGILEDMTSVTMKQFGKRSLVELVIDGGYTAQ